MLRVFGRVLPHSSLPMGVVDAWIYFMMVVTSGSGTCNGNTEKWREACVVCAVVCVLYRSMVMFRRGTSALGSADRGKTVGGKVVNWLISWDCGLGDSTSAYQPSVPNHLK